MFETTNWPDTSKPPKRLHKKTTSSRWTLPLSSIPQNSSGTPKTGSGNLWTCGFPCSQLQFFVSRRQVSRDQPSIPKQRYIQQQKLPEIRRNWESRISWSPMMTTSSTTVNISIPGFPGAESIPVNQASLAKHPCRILLFRVRSFLAYTVPVLVSNPLPSDKLI